MTGLISPPDEFVASLMEAIDPRAVLGEKDKALALYYDLLNSAEAKTRLNLWAEAADPEAEADPVLDDARRALLPALLLVESKFSEIPRQWSQVFWRLLSKMFEKDGGAALPERFVELRHTGLAQLRPQSAPTTRDSLSGERFIYHINPQDIALAVPMTRDFVEGDSFAWQFAQMALGLAESHVQSEEILHANVLNTGNVYNPTIGGDGCPLFSDHPIDNGKYSNLLAPAACLNETALEVASAQIGRFPDQAGNLIRARPRKLIVPIWLQFTAERLLKAAAMPVEGYQVLDFLNDKKAWFLTTSVKGLVSVEWKPFRLDLIVEEGRLVLEGSQSYGCGYRNPRGCFASFPEAEKAKAA